MKDYYISTNTDLINIQKVSDLLNDCYWSRDIPTQYVRRFIKYSFCFGAYKNSTNEQIGFARVITDYTTYAYICDLVIEPSCRKQGVAKAIVSEILNNKNLRGLKTWSLRTTKEARNIYLKYGFKPATEPETILEVDDIQIYTRENFINIFADD